VYAVSKPKKWQKEIRQECLLSDQTQSVERSDTNGERSDKVVRNKEEREEIQEREKHSPDFLPEMEKWIWDYYVERVNPGPNYSLTIERRQMLAARHAEMIAKGQTPKKAANNLARAITAFAKDDYHMGRKKGFEGPGRK
jgi:hypothetical protein